MLPTNAPAPEFSLVDQTGVTRSLDDFKGRYVIVYFYPREGTPGCIQEACSIRDSYPEFEKLGVSVVGISVGTPDRHADFAKQYNLPFTLLSDYQQKTARAYGAKGWFAPKRVSYLINPNGNILKCYPTVDPATHATTLLEDVRKALA